MRPPISGQILGLLAATVLGLGWMGSLLHDLRGGSPRPSPLDLLSLLKGARLEDPQPREAPRPPLARAWQSPLAVCERPEAGLLKQLAPLVASLPRRIQTIPTDPSNYGERQSRDAYGNPVDPTPRLVVLHETVYGINSAINTFITSHDNDFDQVSYHMLIGLDGAIVQVLDPRWRAFGAGNSAFEGQWVITNPRVGGSVNNFALHLSLETPLDGENEGSSHSGYSEAQYNAMAVVLAAWMRRFPISWQRITTHRHVDLGGERADPRSFDWQALSRRLVALGVMPCHQLQRGQIKGLVGMRRLP